MAETTTTPNLEVASEVELNPTSQNEQARQGENQSAEPEIDSIPQKFVGKSAAEILEAYNNLERTFHKVSSERAEERRQKDATEVRLKEIEAKLYQPQPQPQAYKPEPEADPLADYDTQFEANPKEAIKNALKVISDKSTSTVQSLTKEQEQRAASEYYYQQKKENQDFVKLEPKMQQLAQEFSDLVRPDKSASVKALKLLHLAARGASVEDYEKAAVERAKKEGTPIRQEKQQAFSESARSAGDKKVSFKDMSTEDMEKYFGFADK